MALRKRNRRIRYRPGNRREPPRLPQIPRPGGRGSKRRRLRVANRRRFLAVQAVLGAIVLAALGLSASVIVRSVRTARLNRDLAALYTADGEAPSAQVAAPPLVAGEAARAARPLSLSRMGLPDGTAIEAASEAAAPSEAAGFHETGPDVLPNMAKLLQRNPDTVGWLYIKGIVSLPVVYQDNTWYLTHDFDGRENASGTLFLDENHPLSAGAQNLLVYGHSMNDGSMFGLLTHYRRLAVLKAHPLIEFSTLWQKETYAVFAVLKVSSDPADPDYFNYFSSPGFATDADFNDYVARARERSLFQIPIDVSPSDALLTLSTCLDEDRLVVLARRLRPSESKDELRSAVETAT